MRNVLLVNMEKPSAGRRKALVSNPAAVSSGADLLWGLLGGRSAGETLPSAHLCSLTYLLRPEEGN